MAVQKYRPYFTLAELKVLYELSKAKPNLLGITKYLESYIHTIEAGYKKPNHVLAPSIGESLGLEEAEESHSATFVSATVRKKLYESWVAKGADGIGFSSAQLSQIHQYRYENDLMESEEEESNYLASLGLQGV